METIKIFDTTLRDGEQAPGCSMNVGEKILMAGHLCELGVDTLEAGFPIATQGDFQAVYEICKSFPRLNVAALARAVRGDVESAARALAPSQNPRMHIFIATSEIHLKRKLRMSQEQVIDSAASMVALARQHTDDVEFSAEDASRTDVAFLTRICRAVVDAGATTVNIPDTVGSTLPQEYGKIIGRIVDEIGHRAVVSVHCHDDLGLATANSLAGVEAGARQVECTINGIGERTGNCALEEIAMIVAARKDLMNKRTSIRHELLVPISRQLTNIIRFGPQPNKAIVGSNAFAHESGIHQDGMLKDPLTYEFIDPRTVGCPGNNLVLGKHSGRHALQERLNYLGVTFNRSNLDQIYRHFVAQADQRKKGLLDEEIKELAIGVLTQIGEKRPFGTTP